MMLSRLLFGVVTACVASASCGKSLYTPLTPQTSDEALMERAIIAMDNREYSTARSSFAKLWANDKSNETTQLYANAILGSAGFDLYDIIVRLLKGADASQIESANDLLDTLAEAVTVDASTEQLDDLSLTLEVLGQAKNQRSQALEFQKCLTVGIYALPIIEGINVSVETIQSTLDGLPSRLSVDQSDGRTCLAQTDVISRVGQDLTTTIQEIGEISERIAQVNEIISQCSLIADSETSTNVNVLTTRVSTVIAQADRGCVVPDSGQLGGRILPSCMASFVASTASTARSGDGLVAGCEIFVNCAQGGCF